MNTPPPHVGMPIPSVNAAAYLREPLTESRGVRGVKPPTDQTSQTKLPVYDRDGADVPEDAGVQPRECGVSQPDSSGPSGTMPVGLMSVWTT